MKNIIKKLLILTAFIGLINFTNAQNSDSLFLNKQVIDTLSLKTVIDSVLTQSPTIGKLLENINSMQLKICLAKSVYLPNVEVDAMASKMSPNPELKIPNLGSFQFYPDYSYDAHLSLSQLIFDFGQTKKTVDLLQAQTDFANLSIEQQKQQISITTSVYYYMLIYYQETEKILNEQIDMLNKHLDFVQKKQETGSAVKYEILSTKVKITSAETNLTQIQSQEKMVRINIGILLGKPDYEFAAKNDSIFSTPILILDSLYKKALNSRDEMILAKKREEIAQMNIGYTNVKQRPSLYFVGNAGFKNGFMPEINKIKPNYFVGVQLKVPIYNGGRTLINTKIANSDYQSAVFDAESTERMIISDVSQNYLNVAVSQKKIEQFELQYEQAKELYSLAEINFKLGTITNLDLLEAAAALSQSEIQLSSAKIEYQINLMKLNAAIGVKMY